MPPHVENNVPGSTGSTPVPPRHIPGVRYGSSDPQSPAPQFQVEKKTPPVDSRKCSTGFLGGIFAVALFLIQLLDLWGSQALSWIDQTILSNLPPQLVAFFFPDFYINAPWLKIGFPDSITMYIIPICYYWLLGVFLGGLISNFLALVTGRIHRISRIWVVLSIVLLAFSTYILYYEQHWGVGDGKIDLQECASISVEADRAECITRLVDANGDISLCYQIQSLDTQYACFRLGALSKKDDTLCQPIKDLALQQKCINEVYGQEAGDTQVQ